jgi:hypothetical protein
MPSVYREMHAAIYRAFSPPSHVLWIKLEFVGASWVTSCSFTIMFPKSWEYVPILLYPEDHLDITGQDIEICVPFEDLHKVREVFNTEFNFCSPFRPGRAHYNQHLAQYPRFKVNGMHQCFHLVPDSHYGANSQAFNDIMHLPGVGFPLLPLPHYVRGLAKTVVSDRDAHNFRVQLEFLIDGMDIDEEWCDNYLDGPAQEHVKSKSTRIVKKLRMGSHPKYDGNLTTYIHNETERMEALGVVGRVMENRGEFFYSL